jgi:ethanolamine utilization microcompartment shell protein EutL
VKYPALFQSPKRQSEYQGYRAAGPDRMGIAMPVLIGAAMIATAILLSTLITAVGTRFVGMESPSEETLWLIDRLTGNVYKCQAAERGKAACDAEIATGSIVERSKR